MDRRTWFGIVALAAAASAPAGLGCGNEVVSTGGAGGSGSSSTGTKMTSTSSTTSGTTSGTTTSSTGAGMNFGDCDTNADCAPDGTCVEVAPGGFRLCKSPVTEATMCQDPMDQCCTSAECSAPAKCYPGPIFPYCGGVIPQPSNECASDLCASPADCKGTAACMPAGTIGNKVATCLAAACFHDSECTKQAGGVCATAVDPCCGVVTGLYCIYPGLNCRSSNDCSPGYYCGSDPQTGEPVCQPGSPACPL